MMAWTRRMLFGLTVPIVAFEAASAPIEWLLPVHSTGRISPSWHVGLWHQRDELNVRLWLRLLKNYLAV